MSFYFSPSLPIAMLLLSALWWVGEERHPVTRPVLVPVEMSIDGGRTLYVAPYEVSVSSWRECFQEGKCTYLPKASSNAASMPITGVNWFDVSEYLAWANQNSTVQLRLPTLAEWRVLNQSLEQPKQAPLFTDPRMAWAATYGQEKSPGGPVRPSGSFSKTSDGIYDLDGNVWEWTSTCYKPGFEGSEAAYCPAYITAGAHEAVTSVYVRNTALGGCATGTPPSHIGLRLVSDGPHY